MFLNLYIYSGMSSRDIEELRQIQKHIEEILCIHLHQFLSSLKDWPGVREERIGTKWIKFRFYVLSHKNLK